MQNILRWVILWMEWFVLSAMIRNTFTMRREHFCIMPDIPHAVESVNDTAYSMISICISANKILEESENEVNYSKKLKQIIIDAPGNTCQIKSRVSGSHISVF